MWFWEKTSSLNGTVMGESETLIHSLYEINFPTLSQPQNGGRNLFNRPPPPSPLFHHFMSVYIKRKPA